ncbi:hypothetical protein [Polaribacter glomeratus]|uniref:Uncharacterized protein n=1 Tax=Polaribacter glomeratus TaxID=102 RepID=A0A2S7WY19_9FLAO|nr:hypothetical protein [Polaribacter glomeratus]PQJ82232.1 hypothetical protein BTO16_06425 [Polaribacter glomeratus]TXD66827.1 hypothetical protein ESX12_04735 [Polaribacter glomeratus]
MDKEIKNSVNYISKKTCINTGFSTPADYFNKLEAVIDAKLSEKKLPKENGFKTPDNYFNTIENSVLSKVLPSAKEVKIISFKDRVLKLIPYAAAASIILFIGLNSFVFKTDEELTMDSLSDVEIEYWLDSNTLFTNDISIVLEDDLLEENDFYFTTIKDETIEDYINSIDNIALFNEIN